MPLAASDVERLISSLPSCPPHYSGVTTYIKTVLMRGIRYRAPVCGGPPSSSGRTQRGLVLGRRLDTAFRRYAESGVCGSLTSVVASVLRRRGIRVVGTQPTVFDPRLRVKTAVDGVGVDSNGTVWIIELKNTQHTLADHRSAYSLACPNNPYLSNGMRNSERVRHALQAGFGVLGFCRAFPGRRFEVRAIVVVNCTDGAIGYNVDCDEYASSRVFPASTSVVSMRDGGTWDPRNAELRRLVSRLGFPTGTHRRVCSGTVAIYKSGSSRGPVRRLAIGIGKSTRRSVLRQKADVRALVVTRGHQLVAETI